MREAGQIPFGWIADNTTWMRKPATFTGIEQCLNSTSHFYRRNLWAAMPVYVEVWCEKDALAGVLMQETEVYDVPLMVAKGYASISFLHSAAKTIEAKGKPAHIYHFGDLDPSGVDAARGVVRRFYKTKDRPFPIMQIGSGIFATNESSKYDWRPFKKQAEQGIRALLRSYPKLDFFALKPIHIELRYIDAFPASLVGNVALFTFLEKQTTLKIALPQILTDKKVLEPDAEGRLGFRAILAGRKQSQLLIDLASGKNADTGEDIVRLETKVISLRPDVPTLASSSFRAIDSWLEKAHEITSPLFKQLIKPETLANYRIGN